MPALRKRAITGVSEVTRFESASSRFTGVRNTRLEGTTPIVGVRMELLVNFGPAFAIIQTFVDFQSQLSPRVRRLVISPDRTYRDGVGGVAIGRFLRVSKLNGEAHHRGRDKAC